MSKEKAEFDGRLTWGVVRYVRLDDLEGRIIWGEP